MKPNFPNSCVVFATWFRMGKKVSRELTRRALELVGESKKPRESSGNGFHKARTIEFSQYFFKVCNVFLHRDL
jgi:hypothetical protein